VEIRGKNIQFYRHNADEHVFIIFMAFWWFFPRCNYLKNGSKLINDFFEKLFLKTKKDPLVPIGLFCTVTSFLTGITAFHNRQKMISLRMMKSRIIFQGITIGAVLLSRSHHL